MRRSPQPRVRSQGELLFEAGALRAQLVNLSHGGLCARGDLPTRVVDGIEQRPAVLGVALGLLDGRPPISAQAKLAWVRHADDGAGDHTFGMSFVDLSGDDRARLEAAISARLEALPTSPMSAQPQSAVRLRLPSGPVLRADVDSIDHNGALLGAELPWLRVGATLDAEVDGAWTAARITWVGMDLGPSGAARIRLRVELEPNGAQRREITRPYFFIDDAQDVSEADVRAELDAIADGDEDQWARDRLGSREAVLLEVGKRSAADERRGQALVRRGSRRRVRLAVVRAAIVLIALTAAFLLVRRLGHPAASAPSGDIPPEVRPMSQRASAPPALVEDERAPAIDEPGGSATPQAAAKPAPPPRRSGKATTRAPRTKKSARKRADRPT